MPLTFPSRISRMRRSTSSAQAFSHFSRRSGKTQRRSDDLFGGHREDDTSSVDSSSGSRYPGPRRGGRQGPRAQRGKGMGVRLAQGYVGVSPESMRGTLGGQTCSGYVGVSPESMYYFAARHCETPILLARRSRRITHEL